MEITGSLISLVPVRNEHLPLMVNWRNSPAVSGMMLDQSLFTLEKQVEWFEKLQNDSKRGQFIIQENKQHKPIGAINLTNIDRKNLHCDWGYYIGENNFRMGGYAIEAEFLILKHAFENLGMNKVYCQTLSYNKKVIAIHSKFGFKIDGCMRQHYKTGIGFEDVVIMSILKDEFNKSSIAIEKLLNSYYRK